VSPLSTSRDCGAGQTRRCSARCLKRERRCCASFELRI